MRFYQNHPRDRGSCARTCLRTNNLTVTSYSRLNRVRRTTFILTIEHSTLKRIEVVKVFEFTECYKLSVGGLLLME